MPRQKARTRRSVRHSKYDIRGVEPPCGDAAPWGAPEGEEARDARTGLDGGTPASSARKRRNRRADGPRASSSSNRAFMLGSAMHLPCVVAWGRARDLACYNRMGVAPALTPVAGSFRVQAPRIGQHRATPARWRDDFGLHRVGVAG